jgi:predicted ATPase/class 3 adenylate cyclase
MPNSPDRTLPSGTLTFVFTDIEGSTRLALDLGTARFEDVLAYHGRVVRGALEQAGGVSVRSEGDSFFYVFTRPTAAVAGAMEVQRRLHQEPAPHGVTVRVRIGMHTGEASVGSAESGVDYVGYDVHHAARIAGAGHGGQVLVSEATAALVRDGTALRDLGEHRFKDLSRGERVYQLVISELPSNFPPLRALDVSTTRLPVQVTSFIGRAREVAEGVRLLANTRVLTLTGPGGTGKTRLSLQIASHTVADFPGGTTFVALAPIQDAAHVAPAISQALGLDDGSPVPHADRIAAYLADRKALLVLDNFEQVLDAAPVVADLVRRCPHVKILVSSRAPLHISGEQEMPVPPLSMPDPTGLLSAETVATFEAVRLFIERAVAIRPDFVVTNDNAPAVAAICARLDGLPLAIELAAARVRLLSPAAILARLEGRLGLLQSGARDVPARQRTLRGAIAWSEDLLEEPCRALFRRFAVFGGGATLGDVEAVCGEGLGADVFDTVTTLVDHSLLRQHDDAGEPRLHMLETIREYAQERLAASPEKDDIERRHTARYLALVEEASPHLLGRDRRVWLARLDAEHDNLRAAVHRAITSSDTSCALRLVGASWRYWQLRDHVDEGFVRAKEALALPRVADHPVPLEAAHAAAGGLAYWRGDMLDLTDHAEAGVALARANGDPVRLSAALYNLSFAGWGLAGSAIVPDLRSHRRAYITEAVALSRAAGDDLGTARAHWAMSMLEAEEKEWRRSIDAASEAVRIFRAAEDLFDLSWALQTVGLGHKHLGELVEARVALNEQLTLIADVGDLRGISVALGDHSELSEAEGNRDVALRLSGACAAFRTRYSGGLGAYSDVIMGRIIKPESEADQKAFDEGFAMSVDEAVKLALTPS